MPELVDRSSQGRPYNTKKKEQKKITTRHRPCGESNATETEGKKETTNRRKQSGDVVIGFVKAM